MKTFSLLLAFILAGVFLGAEPEHPAKSQGKEPVYEGKTLGEWVASAKDKDRHAIAELGVIGPKAIPTLVELLKDKDEEVRRAAAEALAMVGPAAIPVLTELLRDKNKVVRSAAAEGLWPFVSWSKTTIPPLIELFKDKDTEVRRAAVRALEGIGPSGPKARTAIPALTKLLRDKDDVVRSVAANNLGAIGPAAKTAIPALTELLHDKEERGSLVCRLGTGEYGVQGEDGRTDPYRIASGQRQGCSSCRLRCPGHDGSGGEYGYPSSH